MALKKYIQNLRKSRKLHKLLGTSLSILLFISATTGILLALKKNLSIIQPPTINGVNKDISTWLPLVEIDSIAKVAFYAAQPDQTNNTVKRFDAQPSKGVIKAIFEKGYWEVQIDGHNGKVLSIAKRHSDWIEALHDGSIISDPFKLVSMNILGFGVLFLIITGLWLWYGPKKFRSLKRKKREKKD